MEQKIKEWIRIARRISRYLLKEVGGQKEQEKEEVLKIKSFSKASLQRLNDPSYYTHRLARTQEINEKYTYEKFIAGRKQKVQHRRLQVLRYAAVALLALALGAMGWFYQHSAVSPITTVSDLQFNPGNTKASLVLGNGQEITLDTQITFTEQDGTVIQNDKEGEVSYQTTVNTDSTLHYNTLRVPRGGEYRIVLADGTKVWVNSESELVFPTRFSSVKREVFLKGEAYFEIAHDKQKPFYVRSGVVQVHATGTAFNVMSYNDEPDLRVTLVEGGVNIEDNREIISRLTPNTQFILNKADGTYDVQNIDSRVATSWKNGSFFFDNESLGSITRKLSRWYGIDIEYDKPEISQYKFSGEIRKYENADKVLDMLKLTNEITYTVRQDQKVVIYSTE